MPVGAGGSYLDDGTMWLRDPSGNPIGGSIRYQSGGNTLTYCAMKKNTGFFGKHQNDPTNGMTTQYDASITDYAGFVAQCDALWGSNGYSICQNQ